MNEATVDTDIDAATRLEWILVAIITVFLAMLALADVVMLLRLTRTVDDAYMTAASSARRDRIQTKHNKLRTLFISTVFTIVFVGLCASAALYGMTLESLGDVGKFFIPVLVASFVFSFLVLLENCLELVTFTVFLRD